MEECWLPIKNYEGLYEVSNFGRVRSLKRIAIAETHIRTVRERFLKPSINPRGYAIARLYKDGVRKNHTVARLVATAFIPNPLNKPEIDHIDGIRTNNHVSNLCWATPRENTNNPITLQRRLIARENINTAPHNPSHGGQHTFARKVACLDLATGVVTHYSYMQEATASGCSLSSISKCCRGIIDSCKGKHFYYEDE